MTLSESKIFNDTKCRVVSVTAELLVTFACVLFDVIICDFYVFISFIIDVGVVRWLPVQSCGCTVMGDARPLLFICAVCVCGRAVLRSGFRDTLGDRPVQLRLRGVNLLSGCHDGTMHAGLKCKFISS